MLGGDEAARELLVPDAVLGQLAAGVGLPAMAVAEAGIDPQGDLPAGGTAAVLVDHVRRAAVDVDVLGQDQLQRLGVEDVGGVDDLRGKGGRRKAEGGRWRRRFLLPPSSFLLAPSRGHRPADLPRADAVHQGPVPPHQVEDRQVRARLFGVTDHVEGPQVLQPLDDRSGVVHEARRAELPGQLHDGKVGDVVSGGDEFGGRGAGDGGRGTGGGGWGMGVRVHGEDRGGGGEGVRGRQ